LEEEVSIVHLFTIEKKAIGLMSSLNAKEVYIGKLKVKLGFLM
jgi:hypothetical protein